MYDHGWKSLFQKGRLGIMIETLWSDMDVRYPAKYAGKSIVIENKWYEDWVEQELDDLISLIGAFFCCFPDRLDQCRS